MLELILPYPPSVNHYWVHGRGHAYISKAGKTFRNQVIWECRAKRVTRLAGRLAVSIRSCAPDRRRRDCDNVLKATLDALQHAGVYEDDAQIDDLRIYRGPVIRGGALQVQICVQEQAGASPA